MLTYSLNELYII